ncbi:8853_t:CDS:2, partial [Entrophospora sp. SA101]
QGFIRMEISKSQRSYFIKYQEGVKVFKKEYRKCTKELNNMMKRLDELRKKKVINCYESEVDDLEKEKQELNRRRNLRSKNIVPKEKNENNILNKTEIESEKYASHEKMFSISGVNTRKRIETAAYYGANQQINWKSFVKFP